MNLMSRCAFGAQRGPPSVRIAIQALRTASTSTASAPAQQPTGSVLSQTTPPPVVQHLGYGGAVPFVTGALACTLTSDPTFFARATQLYGSSILSFLGAVHWGVAMRSIDATASARNVDFLYGVTPSLVAWAAALMPAADGLALLTTGFCAAYAYDYVRFGVPGSTPRWYMRLRGPLSIAAIGGCGVSYLAVKRKLAADECAQQLLAQAADQVEHVEPHLS